MWRWAGCSRPPGSSWPARRDRARTGDAAGPAAFAWLAIALAYPAAAGGQTLLSQDEALELAFPPPAGVERETAFLDEAQIARADALAGEARVRSGVVTYYVGRVDGQTLGYAYFDVHRVRTLDEVLMVVVSPEQIVKRVEVVRFAEPREYLPPDRWLRQFPGRGLDEGLSTGGGIVNITGATLTADAVTRAVRRVLALHRTIHGGSDG